jgi:very-short-patch-repair endonuclease
MDQIRIYGARTQTANVARAGAPRRELTNQERVLWQALRGNALDGLHFRRRQIIRGHVVDFYCRRARLVIEVDGPVRDQRQEDDEFRDRVLAEHGIEVLRIPSKAVDLSPKSVVWLIRQRALKACEQNSKQTPDLFPAGRGTTQRKSQKVCPSVAGEREVEREGSEFPMRL